MLGTIILPKTGESLPRLQFAEMLAAKHGMTVESVLAAARHCETDMDLPEDTPSNVYACVEEFCQAVEYTKAMREGHKPPETPKEARLTVHEPKSLDSQELEIVEAARNARLDNGAYSQLRKVFDFAEDMSSVRVKQGAIVTPTDWSKLLGVGFDLGRRSVWLMAEAINHLMVLGKENSLIQIADDFGFSYSYASNLARVAQRVPAHKRLGMIPTVVVEIASRNYSEDPHKNAQTIDSLLEQAKTEGWNCSVARSHTRHAQGHDDPIEVKKSSKERIRELEYGYSKLLDHYLAAANSGDCGNWEPEEEEVVKLSRSLLGQPRVIMVQP